MKKNKKVLKKTVGVAVMIILGFGYAIYYILKFFDTNVPKVFMKAPRLFRQLVIYSMIILSCLCFVGREKQQAILQNTVQQAENVQEELIIENTANYTEEEEIIEIEPVKCQLSEIECMIYNEGEKQELSQDQIYMVLSISKQETGHWTSSAFKKLYNIGGIMDSDGLRGYNSLNEGIADTVRILKNYYFNKGLDTLEKIQKKYCPIGAENDPTGLNNYWLKNTTIFYNEYLERVK